MIFLLLLMLIQPAQAKVHESFADDAFVCLNATEKFEDQYKIKEHLLTTISNVETGRWNEAKARSVAWPWTINARGKGQFFKTKAEAVKAVKALQKRGIKSIDVGCMQINLYYHGDAFKSVEDALDPTKNVEYSAQFLTSLYKSRGKDWIRAAMGYHSSVPKKANRYKKKLVSHYELVKKANDRDLKIKVASNDSLVDTSPKVKKNVNKPAKKVVSASQWREAKLSEYRKNKKNNI